MARNILLNLGTEFWIFLVLLIGIPKLVSFLGESSFGLFSIAWVVVGYLAFLDIGVSSATTKFTSESIARSEEKQIGSLIRTALVTNFCMGILACGFAIAISPLLVRYAFKIPPALHNQALAVFVGVAFALPTLLVQGVLRGALSAYQRFDWINVVNGTVITLQWVVMILLAWKGFSVVTVVWVAVAARAVMDVVYVLLLQRLVPNVFANSSFCWHTLRQLLHFGAWVSASQIMSPILVYLDRMVIAGLISLPAVTIYTIPTEIFNRLGVFPSSLMATLFPAFSRHSAAAGEQEQATRIFRTTNRLLLLVFLPLFTFLIVNGRDVLTVWMGLKFASEGTLILQILAVGALLNFLGRLPFGAVQALGRPDVTARIHLIEVPLYVVMCYLLTLRFGLTGAALACTFRVSLDAALMYWAARKYCYLRLKSFAELGRILTVGLLLTGCMIGVRILLHGTWEHLFSGVSLLLIWYVAAWMHGLSGDDRPAFVRTLRLAMQKAN